MSFSSNASDTQCKHATLRYVTAYTISIIAGALWADVTTGKIFSLHRAER